MSQFFNKVHRPKDDKQRLLAENEQNNSNNNSDRLKLTNNDSDDEPSLLPRQNDLESGTVLQNNAVIRNANSSSNEDLAQFVLNGRFIPNSSYESLDYEICENVLWKKDQKNNAHKLSSRKEIARWIVFLLIGIITALVACAIDISIEELSGLKYKLITNMVQTNTKHGDLYVPYLFWIITSIVPVGIGAALVAYVEPIAAGSGIPQVKCYLNGVKVPRIVRIKTLIVKAVGVITSVVGGLAGGKEGPMIHSGAVIAAGISQGKSTTLKRDLGIFKYFRDDHEKRDFVLGGASAGVAAAFGAPIGGVLFSLEEAASFWNQNLIWRTLVASFTSSFTLNIVLSAYHGLKDFTIPGLFNLGKFDELPYEYFELPIFVLMGITGGLLGALWNSMNTKLNIFRKNYIKPKYVKVIEALLVSIMGVTIACTMIYLINDCRALGNDPTNFPVQMFCGDNEYNAVASLWFQTPEASVKSLFHDPPGSHKILTLAVFVVVYYILSCLTFGLVVSLGIFIPTVLVGAAWGRLIAMFLFYIFPAATFLNPGKYALIGAAAHLGGVLRMTISLSVILIETTGVDTSFAFPLVITLITGKWIGDYFNEGIYDTQIEKINHVPMLRWELPELYNSLKASQIMNRPVICVKLKEKVSYICNILKDNNHNGFPVVEDVQGDRSKGRVCGLILRSQLVLILKHKLFDELKQFWEKNISIETFRNEYPRFPEFRDISMHMDKIDYTIDFSIFMNPSPVRVNNDDSVPRIFQKFRALGLRHMIVINKENRVEGIITRKNFICKK